MVHVLWAPGSIKVVKQCLANKKWVIYSFTAGYIGKLVQRYYGTNSHVSTVTVMSYPITLPYFSSFLIYALVLKVCRTPTLFKDVYMAVQFMLEYLQESNKWSRWFVLYLYLWEWLITSSRIKCPLFWYRIYCTLASKIRTATIQIWPLLHQINYSIDKSGNY